MIIHSPKGEHNTLQFGAISKRRCLNPSDSVWKHDSPQPSVAFEPITHLNDWTNKVFWGEVQLVANVVSYCTYARGGSLSFHRG
jgi:hypothetical protein